MPSTTVELNQFWIEIGEGPCRLQADYPNDVHICKSDSATAIPADTDDYYVLPGGTPDEYMEYYGDVRLFARAANMNAKLRIEPLNGGRAAKVHCDPMLPSDMLRMQIPNA